ncbi:MAG TPA: hypothetical protein VMU95_16820 [Trebonia sp.]|nr:hypothetical protein [Trebonia sp.]
MADLRRVFSDVGRVQAQLETAVNLRLRSELGLPLVLFESMTAIADTESCRVHELAAGLGRPVLSAEQIAQLAATLRELRRAGLGPPA